MVDAPETTNDNLANSLFGALTDDADFTLPALDLSGSEFDIPDAVNNDLYATISSLTEADLTSRQVNGAGMFDALMESVSNHMKEQYENGRISGTDYTNAYIAMTQAALGSAVQYLLSKDTAYWQAHLVQQQARAAEASVVVARMGLEESRAKVAAARVDTQRTAAEYALSKMRLITENAGHDLALLQQTQTTEQTNNIIAQKDKTLYETANLLPTQKIGLEKDNAIKTYQHDSIMPAQKAEIDVDVLTKTYQKDNILPAQLENINEQMESQRAKTLDLRSDGVTPVTGAIGKQKDLQTQQIESYQADAMHKFVKAQFDTWITQKSLDEGLTPPSSITDAEINSAVSALRTKLSMPHA